MSPRSNRLATAQPPAKAAPNTSAPIRIAALTTVSTCSQTIWRGPEGACSWFRSCWRRHFPRKWRRDQGFARQGSGRTGSTLALAWAASVDYGLSRISSNLPVWRRVSSAWSSPGQIAAGSGREGDMRDQPGHRLRLDDITHRIREFVAVGDVDLDVGGRVGRLARTFGLREIHAVADRVRLRAADAGTGPVRRRERRSPGANRRGVGIVFQNYALFPHMTVWQNVAYGLEAHHWPRQRIAPRVEAMLNLTHMRPFAERLPRQLSADSSSAWRWRGASRSTPRCCCWMSPSARSTRTCGSTCRSRSSGSSATTESRHPRHPRPGGGVVMADRIAVMNRGRIEQVASPTDIYDRPATLFVNQFVGTTISCPASSWLPMVPAARCGSQAACCEPRTLPACRLAARSSFRSGRSNGACKARPGRVTSLERSRP